VKKTCNGATRKKTAVMKRRSGLAPIVKKCREDGMWRMLASMWGITRAADRIAASHVDKTVWMRGMLSGG
jgi:hypothetical protein